MSYAKWTQNRLYEFTCTNTMLKCIQADHGFDHMVHIRVYVSVCMYACIFMSRLLRPSCVAKPQTYTSEAFKPMMSLWYPCVKWRHVKCRRVENTQIWTCVSTFTEHIHVQTAGWFDKVAAKIANIAKSKAVANRLEIMFVEVHTMCEDTYYPLYVYASDDVYDGQTCKQIVSAVSKSSVRLLAFRSKLHLK